MPDPARILIHAGLPESVPGPVARFLWANRQALRGLDLVLPGALAEPARAARHFARHGQPLALADLAEALEAAVPRRLSGDGRDAVVACDALSGPAPGLGGVSDWEAATALAAVVAGWFAERFPGSALRMVWTTRGDWVTRAWLQSLVAERGRRTEAEFARALAAAGAAEAVAAAAEAAGEAGGGRLEAFALPLEEGAAHPQGPGGALLELLELAPDQREALRPVGGDRQPGPALAAELLAVNLSDLPDAKARATRRAMLEKAGFPAWAGLLSPSGTA